MKIFNLKGLVTKEEFFESLEGFEIVKKKVYQNKTFQEIEYYNVSAAFDTENSSFYYNNTKMSCMYIWMFGINGYVIAPRTWEEYEEFIYELQSKLDLGEYRRLPVYCHNLSYDFQFIKDRHTWIDIFARDKRSPIKATTSEGIEYRCSYFLSGCSLEQTCKDLNKYKVEKKVGDLDYDLLRFPNTKLDDKELGYCVYDVLCVMAYIQEQIEYYGDVTLIPMTKTGKVRNYCREYCFNDENKKEYKKLMNELTLNDINEYNILKRCFQGGFTHSNYRNCKMRHINICSMDFTSSYPSVMVCEDKFPISKGEWIEDITIEKIEKSKAFFYVFNIELEDVEEIPYIPDHFLSISKCYKLTSYEADNGRLISAKTLQTTMNNIDWETFIKCYTFKVKRIGKCIRYKAGYLPRVFVQCVLDFYKDKTTLKDVAGMEVEYQLKKEFLNSCFGMTIQDPVNEDIFFEDWHEDENGNMTQWDYDNADEEECIKRYNRSKNRFLFYPWGCAITSLAKKNLWTGILELGQDYIYSDTDSLKFCNYEKHKDYFEEYNKNIDYKMKKACVFNKLNFEDTRPFTVKGKQKPLGYWDNETEGYVGGVYKRFKTLGAKRYLVEYEDEEGTHIKATIAGANKKLASKYIASQEDPFEFFDNNMVIDKENSGRLVHTYIDKPFDFVMKDYQGNIYEGHELSGVHMEKSAYSLSIASEFLRLLTCFREDYLL